MKKEIFKTIYSISFILLIPIILLRLYYKSLKSPLYRKRIPERFGFFKTPTKKGGIWIHAVSVGEVVAAIPIVQYLKRTHPEQLIVFTTMTAMGSNRVKQAFGDQVFHVYVPYDIPWVVNRFFVKTEPTLCVILETELWPNILAGCKARHIPVIVANAHLSERSVRGYNRFHAITSPMLEALTTVAAQSELDAKRFLAIGLSPKKLSVMGNIKFDVCVSNSDDNKTQAFTLRQMFGERPVWIAASTHPGEEALVLHAFKILQKILPNVLLILAPRHPERFKGVEALIKQQNLTVITRSSQTNIQVGTEIYLADSMGELLMLYQAADIAFVGGSLVPIGGHNLLEPAALGLPIITGPYLHNYIAISELLLEAKGMLKIENPEMLAMALQDWFTMPEKRLSIGKNALQVVQNNQGNAEHVFVLIEKALQDA